MTNGEKLLFSGFTENMHTLLSLHSESGFAPGSRYEKPASRGDSRKRTFAACNGIVDKSNFYKMQILLTFPSFEL